MSEKADIKAAHAAGNGNKPTNHVVRSERLLQAEESYDTDIVTCNHSSNMLFRMSLLATM